MSWYGLFVKLPADDSVVHHIIADGKIIPRRRPDVVDHRLWWHYSMRHGGWVFILTPHRAMQVKVYVSEPSVVITKHLEVGDVED